MLQDILNYFILNYQVLLVGKGKLALNDTKQIIIFGYTEIY